MTIPTLTTERLLLKTAGCRRCRSDSKAPSALGDRPLSGLFRASPYPITARKNYVNKRGAAGYGENYCSVLSIRRREAPTNWDGGYLFVRCGR